MPLDPEVDSDLPECDLPEPETSVFAAGAGAAADAASDQLCTPPCPRHAPLCDLPLQLEPSLQVALAASPADAACSNGAHDNAPINPIAYHTWILIISSRPKKTPLPFAPVAR